MGVAALLISVVALVVAGYSVWFTRRADIRGEFAHYREERREQPEERERRESEEKDAAARQAKLRVEAVGGQGGPTAGTRILCFRIYNAGPAIARDIRLWLAQPSAAGAAVSALVRSDAFSRQAKGVVDEAKTRASELPDDLVSRMRQTQTSQSSRNGGGQRRGSSSRKTSTSRKTKAASR